MKRALPLLVIVAAIAGVYVYASREPAELVLTGIVTTNDLVVSPQIGGRILKLHVQEGDPVKAGQLVAEISPEELRAESAYATHNVEGYASQISQAQAALRLEERQTDEQTRQAESTLASTEAQQAAVNADLEAARLKFDRTQNLSREGVAAAQELDQARTAYEAARAKVEALRKQVDAQMATVALARASAEQVLVRRSQVQANEHMQEAAAAQQARADVRLAYTSVKAPIA